MFRRMNASNGLTGSETYSSATKFRQAIGCKYRQSLYVLG